MECNKDEAIRAKEIAVRKFLEKDIFGAAKFAVKAQKLHPELDGISHLVANFELHVCAKFRRNGEIDWYRVLGVNPSVDTDTISKQYRKMALLLHPDKNHEVGSESAFKLLSEAFRVLKDQTIRLAYDQRTNQQSQQNVPSHGKFVPVYTQAGYSAASDWSHFKQGVETLAKPSGAQQNRPTVGGCSGAAPRPVNNGKPKRVKKSDHKTDTSTATYDNEENKSFWTRCTSCKMQFQYPLMFLNQHLSCPNCETAFQALGIPIPSIWQNYDKLLTFSHLKRQKLSQMNGSSVATCSYRADKGNPSNKKSNQRCNEGDGNKKLEIKRQKLDGKD